MKQGFLAFVLASVFLFAIVTSAARFSSQQQDISYQKYQLTLLQGLAVKKAFYDSISQAATVAYAAAVAADAPPKHPVEEAVAGRIAFFESELRSQLAPQGTDVVFWCGPSDVFSRQQASADMAKPGNQDAIPPAGTFPIPAPAPAFLAGCPHSIEAGVLSVPKKLHLSRLGFSIYSKKTGIGYAAIFPPDLEVDF